MSKKPRLTKERLRPDLFATLNQDVMGVVVGFLPGAALADFAATCRPARALFGLRDERIRHLLGLRAGNVRLAFELCGGDACAGAAPLCDGGMHLEECGRGPPCARHRCGATCSRVRAMRRVEDVFDKLLVGERVGDALVWRCPGTVLSAADTLALFKRSSDEEAGHIVVSAAWGGLLTRLLPLKHFSDELDVRDDGSRYDPLAPEPAAAATPHEEVWAEARARIKGLTQHSTRFFEALGGAAVHGGARTVEWAWALTVHCCAGRGDYGLVDFLNGVLACAVRMGDSEMVRHALACVRTKRPRPLPRTLFEPCDVARVVAAAHRRVHGEQAPPARRQAVAEAIATLVANQSADAGDVGRRGLTPAAILEHDMHAPVGLLEQIDKLSSEPHGPWIVMPNLLGKFVSAALQGENSRAIAWLLGRLEAAVEEAQWEARAAREALEAWKAEREAERKARGAWGWRPKTRKGEAAEMSPAEREVEAAARVETLESMWAVVGGELQSRAEDHPASVEGALYLLEAWSPVGDGPAAQEAAWFRENCQAGAAASLVVVGADVRDTLCKVAMEPARAAFARDPFEFPENAPACTGAALATALRCATKKLAPAFKITPHVVAYLAGDKPAGAGRPAPQRHVTFYTGVNFDAREIVPRLYATYDELMVDAMGGGRPIGYKIDPFALEAALETVERRRLASES